MMPAKEISLQLTTSETLCRLTEAYNQFRDACEYANADVAPRLVEKLFVQMAGVVVSDAR